MKLVSAAFLLVAPGASAFSPISIGRVSTSLDAAILYDSQTGNTEKCAEYLAQASGVSAQYVGDVTSDFIENEDCLIVGAPTWHTGEDECRSGTAWDEWLYDTLPNMKGMDGKKVAIFGCGDQASYGDYYCDAAGELYDQFTAAGAKVYGFTSTEGYDHVDSKAQVESGKFCGLMFDEDNQYDLSEDRAKEWVGQLKEEGFF